MGGRDGVIPLPHLFSEPVHLPAGVCENDRLGDGEGLVEVTEGVELEVLLEWVEGFRIREQRRRGRMTVGPHGQPGAGKGRHSPCRR